VSASWAVCCPEPGERLEHIVPEGPGKEGKHGRNEDRTVQVGSMTVINEIRAL